MMRPSMGSLRGMTASVLLAACTLAPAWSQGAPPFSPDGNRDGQVTDFELLGYIDLWAAGEVDDFPLLAAIDWWVTGERPDIFPTEPTLRLLDAGGAPLGTVVEEEHPTLMGQIVAAAPGQPVEMMLYRNGRPVYRDAQGNPRPLLLTADERGALPPTALLWDLGIDPLTGVPIPSGGAYTVRAVGPGFDLMETVGVAARGRSRQAGAPLVWAMRAGRRFARGSVPEGEAVWATGLHFPPGRRVRLYVVPDRSDWASGDSLEDVTGLIEEITTTPEGGFADAVRVWPVAEPVGGRRDFDLVVDVADAEGNFDLRYTPGRDALDAGLTTGFTVQGPPRFGERLALASDTRGVYRDLFAAGDRVAVWVNPPWRPLAPHAMVKKYICLHRASWRAGDALVDVTGRPEWDLVRYACSNQYVAVVWPPPLTPGIYDPVIDVNQNDVYDEGDILGLAFEVVGIRPDRLFLAARFPLINPGESTPLSALLVDRHDVPVAGVRVDFSLVGSGGTLDPRSAVTGADGRALTALRAGAVGGIALRVRATAQANGSPLTAETQVHLRGMGGIHVIID